MQVSVTNGGTTELTANGKNAWLNFLVMSNELASPMVLWCPADKDHVLATNLFNGFSAKNISYFVGLDAVKDHPQMLLSGDDSFAIRGIPLKSGLVNLSTNTPIAWTASRHGFCGNVGFADGSIGFFSNSSFTNWLHQAGSSTNRLAIP